MERPVSRRRHRTVKQEDEVDASTDTSMSTTGKPVVKDVESRTRSIWGYIAALIVVICAAYTLLARGAQTPLLQTSSHHGDSSIDIDEPTRLQDLHPEDHIYRPPTTIKLNLTVSFGMRRPDGVVKKVYLINDLFQGPTIEARSGDRLLVSVHNALEDEELSMHWHGLHMRGHNDMDGVDSVTQCPITPGGSFLYNFTIAGYQSGTFWYHSHSSLQRGEGLFGALTIHKPVPLSIRGSTPSRALQSESERFGYDKEALMLMGDWYHDPAHKTMDWYLSAASWGNEPVPDSLLINGVGHFPCSRVAPAKQLDCMDYGYAIPHLKLDPTLTYRIRAINFGTLAGISLSFQNHHVEVITVDGGLEVKKTSREAQSLGILHSGQRVDFILRPRDTQLQQSGFTINLDREDFRYANPAMISEQAYPIIPPSSDSPTAAENSTSLPPLIDIPSTNHTDLSALSSSDKITQAIPEKVDETYMVYVNVMKKSINAFKPYSYMNHTSWLPQSDPRVPLLGLPREEWDKHQLSIITSGNRKNERKGERWVDLVVNNLNEGSHPFHMHGHDFHVISTHQSALKFGSYNPFEPIPPSADFTGPPYDVSVSLARDTVLVPFHGHVVLRFKADNPGLWMFHCHVMWHLSGGMAMIIDERGEEKRQKVKSERWAECKMDDIVD